MRGLRHLFAEALAIADPLAGLIVLTMATAPAVGQNHECGVDYCRNVRGVCVHRPVQSNSIPQGATAQCRDGSCSFSLNHSGTCSHHGGVARWL